MQTYREVSEQSVFFLFFILGRELKGIQFAMEFLEINQKKQLGNKIYIMHGDCVSLLKADGRSCS